MKRILFEISKQIFRPDSETSTERQFNTGMSGNTYLPGVEKHTDWIFAVAFVKRRMTIVRSSGETFSIAVSNRTWQVFTRTLSTFRCSLIRRSKDFVLCECWYSAIRFDDYKGSPARIFHWEPRS